MDDERAAQEAQALVDKRRAEAEALEAKRLAEAKARELAEEKRLAALRAARDELGVALTAAVDDLYDCVITEGLTAVLLQGRIGSHVASTLVDGGGFARVRCAMEVMDEKAAFLRGDHGTLDQSSNIPDFFCVVFDDLPDHVREKSLEIRVLFRLLCQHFLHLLVVASLEEQSGSAPDPDVVNQRVSALMNSDYSSRREYYQRRKGQTDGGSEHALLQRSNTVRHHYTVNLSHFNSEVQSLSSPPSHQLARGDSQSVGEKLHDRDDCAVRCQGGSLGLSCCHGSAVTVYGHSYCCEECNNLKSLKRHLKHGTPSLQSQVVYDSDPDKVDEYNPLGLGSSHAVEAVSQVLCPVATARRTPFAPHCTDTLCS